MTRSVLSAGYAPLDIVIHGEEVRHAAGGTAGNVAAILAFLGWHSSLAGEIGSDAAGAALRSDLHRAGVDTTHLLGRPGATARLIHRTGDSGPTYAYRCPECGVRFPRNRRMSRDTADAVLSKLSTPDVYFFDRANPGTLHLAERLRALGTQIVFEPAFGLDQPLARKALGLASVVKFSAESDNAALDQLPASEEQTQIVTSGESGALYRIGLAGWKEAPAFDFPAIDPAGAGDWTTAAFLRACGDLRGSDAVHDALVWAQAVAAVSCGSVGARGLAHVRTRSSVLRSARRLARTGSRTRRHGADELGLARASTAKGCAVCLEPAAADATEPLRWQLTPRVEAELG